MKMVYCVCNVSVLNQIKNIIEEFNVENYQIIEKVTGKSFYGDPRLDTSVWPGYNSAILMQFKKNKPAKKIIKRLKKFNKEAYNENEKIICSSWELDDFIFK